MHRLANTAASLAFTAMTCLLLAPAASAFTFTNLSTQAGDPPTDLYSVAMDDTDVGDSFTISWGLGDPVLSASTTFTVASYADDAIVLDITLNNTTDLSDSNLANAAILSMGFGVEPDADAALTSSGTVFDMVAEGFGAHQNFTGGFKGIDVCVFAQGCAGGDVNAGLQAGASDSFQITLTPGGSEDFADGATLAFFPVKFQTSAGSFELAGTPNSPVPEPSSALAFAAGSLVVAFKLRRRR